MQFRLSFRKYTTASDLSSSGREVLMKLCQPKNWFRVQKTFRMKFGFQKKGLKSKVNEYDSLKGT